MIERPSNEQIATDYGLWGEYIDDMGVVGEDEFNRMSVEEKLALIDEVLIACAYEPKILKD